MLSNIARTKHQHMVSVERPAAELKVINVRGDGMAPAIENPEILFFVDIASTSSMVMASLAFDDKICVKRLQMIPDKLLVISDN